MEFSTVEFKKAIMALKKYRLEVGVFSDKSKRKKATTGVNNAELMFIHENGSPMRHIPRRPALQKTIYWAQREVIPDTIDKFIDVYFSTDFNEEEAVKVLEKAALKIQNYARKLIYDNDGTFVPNAPSTIAKKGDNHPLFDTGQLARSITCRVVNVKEDKVYLPK